MKDTGQLALTSDSGRIFLSRAVLREKGHPVIFS